MSRRLPARAEPKDLLALTKPSITRMCLVTTAGGLLLAPGPVTPRVALSALVGTALAVAGANAFNMWLERDSDRLMRRTCRRPLPAGRMRPATALKFAALLSLLSFPVLALGTNLLTG
ncbi:MAG: UbiA family prenyltransferase, partial [Myxococcota bacterium]